MEAGDLKIICESFASVLRADDGKRESMNPQLNIGSKTVKILNIYFHY